MENKARYNIVLMGKSGVGKSTLGNYIFGNDIFKTGVGKPVTKNGFHPINFDLQGLPVTVFDSWGIEADKADQWLKELDTELQKRNTETKATEWFHSVFYCVQAGGHRIEEFELKIIKRFLTEKYNVTVIFTKSDYVTEEELDKLNNVLKTEFNNKVKSIEVCSETKTRRDGSIANAYGREKIIDNILNNFWNSISMRLPDYCIAAMQNEVNKWYKEQLKLINEETGFFNAEEIDKKLKNRGKTFLKELYSGNIVVNKINETIKMYDIFQTHIGKLNLNIEFNSLNNIKLEERSWWFYFPTNLLIFNWFTTKDYNKDRLHILLDKIKFNIDKEINKMLPNIINVINNLNPPTKETKIYQVPSDNSFKYGDNVPEDNQLAFTYYYNQALLENSDAQYNLGLCYKIGRGIQQDYLLAFDWLTKSAKKGNSDAAEALLNDVVFKYITRTRKSK